MVNLNIPFFILSTKQQGGQPTQAQAQLVLNAVSGIDDKDALDAEELEYIAVATNAYNETIKAIAASRNLVHIDARAFLNTVATQGIAYDAGTLTSQYITGGAFSLDGIHPTPRGYAAIANIIIAGINETYNSTVPK